VLEAEEILEVQVRIGPTYTPAVQAALTSEDVDALSDLVRRRPDALDELGRHVARVVADLATWEDATVPGGPLAVPLPEVVAEVRQRLLEGDLSGLIPFVFGDIATVGIRDVFGALPAESASLTTRIDPLPDPDSRVSLGVERDALGMRRAELHWQLGALDRWSAIRTLQILGEELGQAGVGRVRVDLHEDGDWPDDLAGGWHHMGTTRMSTDPRRGVVDPDCRVHGMDNLYVAGSSVFPTAGSGTPTMTIVALALRLSDHLRERLA
jgi:choline dehydrogenase-like flavoprotein